MVGMVPFTELFDEQDDVIEQVSVVTAVGFDLQNLLNLPELLYVFHILSQHLAHSFDSVPEYKSNCVEKCLRVPY